MTCNLVSEKFQSITFDGVELAPVSYFNRRITELNNYDYKYAVKDKSKRLLAFTPYCPAIDGEGNLSPFIFPYIALYRPEYLPKFASDKDGFFHNVDDCYCDLFGSYNSSPMSTVLLRPVFQKGEWLKYFAGIMKPCITFYGEPDLEVVNEGIDLVFNGIKTYIRASADYDSFNGDLEYTYVLGVLDRMQNVIRDASAKDIDELPDKKFKTKYTLNHIHTEVTKPLRKVAKMFDEHSQKISNMAIEYFADKNIDLTPHDSEWPEPDQDFDIFDYDHPDSGEQSVGDYLREHWDDD
jgi:hypothetical protein